MTGMRDWFRSTRAFFVDTARAAGAKVPWITTIEIHHPAGSISTSRGAAPYAGRLEALPAVLPVIDRGEELTANQYRLTPSHAVLKGQAASQTRQVARMVAQERIGKPGKTGIGLPSAILHPIKSAPKIREEDRREVMLFLAALQDQEKLAEFAVARFVGPQMPSARRQPAGGRRRRHDELATGGATFALAELSMGRKQAQGSSAPEVADTRMLIAEVLACLPRSEVAHPVRFSYAALTVEALAAACGGDVGRAVGALAYLKTDGLDLTSVTAHSATSVVADAWRTAGLLALSGEGSEALAKLDRGMSEDASVAHRRRQALIVYLRAADAFRQGERGEGRTVADTPTMLQQQVEENRDPRLTFLRHAISAACKLWQNGDGSQLSADERRSYFAIRQGFLTDAAGSPLWRASRRLDKAFGAWLDRYVKPGARPFLPRFLGRQKSPWFAAEAGALSAHLNSAQKLQASAEQLLPRAITDLMEACNNGVRTLAMMPLEDETLDRRAAMLARLSLTADKLSLWREFVGSRGQSKRMFETLPYSSRAPEARREAMQHLQSILVSRRDTDAVRAALQKIERYRVDHDLNVVWLRQEARQLQDALPGFDHKAFENQLNSIEKYLGKDRLAPQLRSLDAVQSYLNEIVTQMKSGNKLEVAEGGSFGLDAARIGLPHSLLPEIAPLVRIGPDVRFIVAPTARFEVATGGHGIDLFLGAERQVSMDAGASASLGNDHVSVSVIGRAGFDVARATGVRLRAKRNIDANSKQMKVARQNGEMVDDHRATMEDVLDVLFAYARTRSHDPLRPSASALDHIAERFFNSDEVSFGYQDYKTVNLRTQERINVSVAPVLTAGAGFEQTWHTAQNKPDGTGHIRRTVAVLGNASKVEAAVGFGLGNPLQYAHDQAHSPSLQTLRLFGVNLSVGTTSQNAALRLTQAGGKCLSHLMYRDVEFARLKDYRAHIEADRALWEGYFGKERLDQHMANLATTDRNNQRHVQRWIGTDALASFLNAAEARADILRAAGAAGANRLLAAIEDAVSAKLQDERSWIPLRLFTSETNLMKETRGITIYANILPSTSVRAEHELSRLDINTATAKAVEHDYWQTVTNHHHSQTAPPSTPDVHRHTAPGRGGRAL